MTRIVFVYGWLTKGIYNNLIMAFASFFTTSIQDMDLGINMHLGVRRNTSDCHMKYCDNSITSIRDLRSFEYCQVCRGAW